MAEVVQRAREREAQLAPIFRVARLTLLWGFRISVAILGVGLVLTVVRGESIDRHALPLLEIGPEIAKGRTSAVIDLGILVMMATPVVAVLAVAVGFFRAGDRRYGVLSLMALLVLAVSVSLSLL